LRRKPDSAYKSTQIASSLSHNALAHGCLEQLVVGLTMAIELFIVQLSRRIRPPKT